MKKNQTLIVSVRQFKFKKNFGLDFVWKEIPEYNIKSNEYKTKETKKDFEGALGFEPRTYRSAVDCSTTELYPRDY